MSDPCNHGTDEGDLCGRDMCCGRLQIIQDPCFCGAVRAPCSSCENATIGCEECGWRLELTDRVTA